MITKLKYFQQIVKQTVEGLSDIEKDKILALYEQNVTVDEISHKIRISRRVANFLVSPTSYGTLEQSGRKRKLSAREE